MGFDCRFVCVNLVLQPPKTHLHDYITFAACFFFIFFHMLYDCRCLRHHAFASILFPICKFSSSDFASYSFECSCSSCCSSPLFPVPIQKQPKDFSTRACHTLRP